MPRSSYEAAALFHDVAWPGSLPSAGDRPGLLGPLDSLFRLASPGVGIAQSSVYYSCLVHLIPLGQPASPDENTKHVATAYPFQIRGY